MCLQHYMWPYASTVQGSHLCRCAYFFLLYVCFVLIVMALAVRLPPLHVLCCAVCSNALKTVS